MIKEADFEGALQRVVFLRGNFPQNLEAYNSPGFGVGSTRFTETMGTVQENITAKFREASSNG